MNQGQTLSNVVINSAQDGEVLQYDGTSGVWRNEEPSITGVDVASDGGLSGDGTAADPLYISGLTNNGDLLTFYNGLARLPIGENGQALAVGSIGSSPFPVWEYVPIYVKIPNGGLGGDGTPGNPLYFGELIANGDLLTYQNQLVRLPIGTTGQVLTVSGGIPTWQTPTPAPSYQRFAAYWSSSTPQTLAAGGSNVMSNYSTIIITNSNFNNSTGQFTIPTSGLYIITINSNIQSPNGTSTNQLSASLLLSGTYHPGMSPTSVSTVPASSTQVYNVGLCWMGYLAQSNTVFGVLANATANVCDVYDFELSILGPF
jgi:hypothetical protein